MVAVSFNVKDSGIRLVLVFAAAFAIRLCLHLTTLPDLLANRIEVSTPITSYKRLKEGLYLYEHGIDPYDGGTCHQAPIFLAILAVLESLPLASLATAILYSCLDMMTCLALLDIANAPMIVDKVGTYRFESWVLATIALFNPLAILANVSKSSSTFTSLAIMSSLSHGLRGEIVASMLCLAFATYFSIYPVFLLAPLIMILATSSRTPLISTGLKCVSSFALLLYSMLYASFVWLGSWNFVMSTYSIVISMTDLTPNIGLWWYFFTEMFEDFRNFFLSVFQLHLLIYVAPLCIKLRNDPVMVFITLCGLAAIFKPYPSIADSSLYMTLLTIVPHLLEHTRYLFLVACALLYCLIFGPAFYYLWIYAGSGNANFFYAITLVWNLTQGILLADTVFAALKHEWELEEPDQRRNKQLEVVQVA